MTTFRMNAKPDLLPRSAFPFELMYIAIGTGRVVLRTTYTYTKVVELPVVIREYGPVRTRIVWADGSVQETDPPGFTSLPEHDGRMLTFETEGKAHVQFSLSFMQDFYVPYPCETCGGWHVVLTQWLPLSHLQTIVATNPMPDRFSIYGT